MSAQIVVHSNQNVIKAYMEIQLSSHGLTWEHVDVHLLEKPSGASIGIDDIKAFLGLLKYKPMQSSHQFGIIFNSERMTTEAQNSLLKTLEEHSDNTIYLLGTSQAELLIPTIRSRCLIYHVPVKYSAESISQAGTKFLQLTSTDRFTFIKELLSDETFDAKIFMDNIIELLRNNLATSDSEARKTLLEAIKLLNQTEKYIRANVNKQLALEQLSLRFDRLQLEKLELSPELSSSE